MAQTYKHQHVEDYIEIIAGYRLPNGKNNHSIFTVGESLISLARYDMKIVPSLAEQSISGISYTDRQAALSTQLVIKYERQLFKHGIDISPVVNNPQYRLPIRELDRSTRAWIDNDIIKLKFPYDVALIEKVREASKSSKGEFNFNRETRMHKAALTEWNLNWIYSFAIAHNFVIDPTMQEAMDIVLATEKTPYKIELVIDGDQLKITNAPDSLIEYINEHLGGFALENILRLSDYAPILGYTVHDSISNDAIASFGTRFWSLCSNRELKVDTTADYTLIKDIAEYANDTNRFPIYVYEPDLSNRLLNEFTVAFPGAVMTLDNKVMDTGITEAIKVVYTSKIPRAAVAGRIPLLVSGAGMLFGGDRQIWIQTAEKIVYFTKDVYTKNSKGPEVCKLN
jgi:hypothetical protein